MCGNVMFRILPEFTVIVSIYKDKRPLIIKLIISIDIMEKFYKNQSGDISIKSMNRIEQIRIIMANILFVHGNIIK